MRMKDIQVGVEYVISDGNRRPNKYTAQRVLVTAIGVDREVRHRGYGRGSTQYQKGVAVTYLEDNGEPVDFTGRRRQTAWSNPPIVRPQVVKSTWKVFQEGEKKGREAQAKRRKEQALQFSAYQGLVILANEKLGEMGAEEDMFEAIDPKHGYGTRIRVIPGVAEEDIVRILAGSER
jgi:hypothetical protein